MALVTDGKLSFVLFSYGDIQWESGAFAGFNYGNTFSVPGSQSSAIEDIETSSNVGVPGLYVYRVDQEYVIEPVRNYTPGTLIQFH